MPRERFYEIPRAAWLFHAATDEAAAREQPEEHVRQWCAFELIRHYGVNVADLVFEHPVKVGSKTYRADIVVNRHGRPFAVIECKEREHTKHDRAMEQAVSYAASQDIGCEFAVYTNGNEWNVRRKIGSHWARVTDLPPSSLETGSQSLDELLRALDVFRPVFSQLDEPMIGPDAQVFLSALQHYFCGRHLLTSCFDENLTFATDNVLRVLGGGIADSHYARGKISAASRLFSRYANASDGADVAGAAPNDDLYSSFACMAAELSLLSNNDGRELTADALLIRLNVALLQYGRALTLAKDGYPAIPAEIHHSLRVVLDHGLATTLHVVLPSALDEKTVSDAKLFCRTEWDAFRKDELGSNIARESSSLFDPLRAIIRALFRRR